jgi:putative membrane protein (TIGR04086 family)
VRKPVKEDLPPPSGWYYIFKGMLLALVISLAVCLLLAAVLFLTSLPERVVPYAVYITSIFSIIIGSAYASRRIRVKGWLNGGLTGLSYVVVLLVVTGVTGLDMDINLNLATKIILAFTLGSIGGILGLNI